MSAPSNHRRSLRIYLLAPVAVLAGILTGRALHRIFSGAGSRSGAFLSGGGGDSQNPQAPLPSFSLEAFKAAPDQAMRRMLAQALPKADAALLPLIAGHLWDREPIVCPEPVWKAVMDRWAQLDAKAAWAWAQERDVKASELKSENKQNSGPHAEKPDWLTGTVLAAWAENDPDSAWAVCSVEEGSPFLKLGSGPRDKVLEKLAESDPARALQLSRTINRKTEYWSDLECGALQSWARISPLEALEYFTKEKSPSMDTRDGSAASLALGWASSDPAACAAWITALPRGDRHKLLSRIPRMRSLQEPEKAARLLSLLPADAALHEAGWYVARFWAEKAPGKTLAWIRTLLPEGPPRAAALVSLAETVMPKDLRAAVAIMDEAGWRDWTDIPAARIPDSIGGRGKKPGPDSDANGSAAQAIGRLLARLAIEDPALGIQCFEKVQVQSWSSVLIPFAAVWFDREPEAAMRWLATHPFPEDKGPGQLLSWIGPQSPEEMRHWALRLPSGPFTTALAGNYAKSTLFPDPEAALKEIPFTDPDSRRAAQAGILDQWAATAPAQALDHLLEAPHPEPELCQSLVGNWARHDASAASAWVTALEPGAVRDAAITGLVASLSNADQLPDPVTALAWSLEIGDPAKRLTAARQVMETWEGNSVETEAARRALSDALDLSEDDRGSLLQLLLSPPP